MPRFFVESVSGGQVILTGPDAAHMCRSLRMKPGDTVTLCDTQGFDYQCVVQRLSPEEAALTIIDKHQCENEPSLSVILYQGLPKGEKMDWIVQKAVELGVSQIVPVRMERCVSRPDGKASQKKTDRWQKIAVEAAKQCGRGILPQGCPPADFHQALIQAAQAEVFLFCYEGGGESVSRLITQKTKTVSVLIGPEGGFSLPEAEAARKAGGVPVTLGKRILRTETAPLAALSVIMYASGNMEP